MGLVGCNSSAPKNEGNTGNKSNVGNEENVNNKITIEQAKEIALEHAKVKSDQITFIRADTKMDNGVEKYEIEFYDDNKEYDYEINAVDGQIIEYDYDVENYDLTKDQATNANEITVEEAKEIALKHANLKGDQVTFERAEIDYDDGVRKYDIEFYYNNKEYDYEIDPVSGQILHIDEDAEYNDIKQEELNNTTKISMEEAKKIALKHANLKEDQVTFEEVELDIDNGVIKYDVEFYYNEMEYNYEIDANTGDVLAYDSHKEVR